MNNIKSSKYKKLIMLCICFTLLFASLPLVKAFAAAKATSCNPYVVDKYNNPIEGIEVSIFRADGSQYYNGKTGSDGKSDSFNYTFLPKDVVLDTNDDVGRYQNIQGLKREYWQIEKTEPNYLLVISLSPNVFNVNLDANGGIAGTKTNVQATWDENMPSIFPSELPIKPNCTFLGFYDSEQDGTKYYNADGTSDKKWDKTDNNTVLYAHWKANDVGPEVEPTAIDDSSNNSYTSSATGDVAFIVAVSSFIAIFIICSIMFVRRRLLVNNK